MRNTSHPKSATALAARCAARDCRCAPTRRRATIWTAACCSRPSRNAPAAGRLRFGAQRVGAQAEHRHAQSRAHVTPRAPACRRPPDRARRARACDRRWWSPADARRGAPGRRPASGSATCVPRPAGGSRQPSRPRRCRAGTRQIRGSSAQELGERASIPTGCAGRRRGAAAPVRSSGAASANRYAGAATASLARRSQQLAATRLDARALAGDVVLQVGVEPVVFAAQLGRQADDARPAARTRRARTAGRAPAGPATIPWRSACSTRPSISADSAASSACSRRCGVGRRLVRLAAQQPVHLLAA